MTISGLSMNKRYMFCFCISLSLMLSGCVIKKQAPMPQKEKVVTRIIDRNAVDSECGGLLIYYDSLTGMNESELEKEKIITRENLAESGNHCDQLRFVLFSLLPESDAKNGKEVARIIEELSARKHMLKRDEKQLVELLSDQLELRTRLRERLNYCDTRQKNLEADLSEEKNISAQLQQQIKEVESKLMKLKSIDEKHDAREQEILIKSTKGDKP